MTSRDTQPHTPELQLAKSLRMMSDISSAVMLSRDVHSLAQLVLDIALDYIEARRGSIMLADDEGELHIIAAKGLDPRFLTQFRAKGGEGVAGKLLRNGMPVIVADIETDERFIQEKGSSYITKSFISHPIACNHRLRGIINISEKNRGVSFSDDDLKLLEVAARQSSIALENALLVDELRKKASALEGMNETLMQSDLAKTEFLIRASHELRTPLNSIKGAAYCLKSSDSPTRAEQAEFVDIIASDADKLNAIVEKLLPLIGSEAIGREEDRVPINLSSLLADVITMPRLRERISGRDVRVSAKIKSVISDVVGDKTRILSFLYNLADGLSAHAGRGSTMTVCLQENDDVRLEVTTSTRLPKAIADCLLNPTPLIEVGRLHDQLGLVVARQIADKHRWTIKMSDEGTGTLVSVLIPKHTKTKKDGYITVVMGLFLDLISGLLCASRCSVMLIERPSNELRMVSSHGVGVEALQVDRVRVGEHISGTVALHGTPMFVEDIERDPLVGRPNLPQYTAKSFLSLPLIVQGVTVAVVNLSNREDGKGFSITDMRIAAGLCERFSRCLESLYSQHLDEREWRRFISCFDRLVSAANQYHKKGSAIPELMSRLFDFISCDEEQRNRAVYVSAVYDLGMMLIDESILKKADLSPAERRAIRVHPHGTVCVLKRFE
ncbi:MAG TPA: GAF domain-containing protein, partial [Dissulfurispiraceae bacterium]|nr:GAF domain-containing protein [Dissulfurispiraceae bacterium]